MWELDYKESWALKNWCFWTVVLKKTLKTPLDCKEIQRVHLKGDQFWVFIGRTDVDAETPIFWPPDAKSWLIWKSPDAGKDWGQEERGRQRVRWLDGITDSMDMGLGGPGSWWWTGGLASCSSWGCKESDTTDWLNWTELICIVLLSEFVSRNVWLEQCAKIQWPNLCYTFCINICLICM